MIEYSTMELKTEVHFDRFYESLTLSEKANAPVFEAVSKWLANVPCLFPILMKIYSQKCSELWNEEKKLNLYKITTKT